MMDEMKFDDLKKQCNNIIIPQVINNYNHSLRNLFDELAILQSCGTDQAFETFLIRFKKYYAQSLMQKWSDFFVRVERYENISEMFDKFMDGLVLNENFIGSVC